MRSICQLRHAALVVIGAPGRHASPMSVTMLTPRVMRRSAALLLFMLLSLASATMGTQTQPTPSGGPSTGTTGSGGGAKSSGSLFP